MFFLDGHTYIYGKSQFNLINSTQNNSYLFRNSTILSKSVISLPKWQNICNKIINTIVFQLK